MKSVPSQSLEMNCGRVHRERGKGNDLSQYHKELPCLPISKTIVFSKLKQRGQKSKDPFWDCVRLCVKAQPLPLLVNYSLALFRSHFSFSRAHAVTPPAGRSVLFQTLSTLEAQNAAWNVADRKAGSRVSPAFALKKDCIIISFYFQTIHAQDQNHFSLTVRVCFRDMVSTSAHSSQKDLTQRSSCHSEETSTSWSLEIVIYYNFLAIRHFLLRQVL